MKEKNDIEKQRSELISFMEKHIPKGIDPNPYESTISHKDHNTCSVEIVNNTINGRRKNANTR